MVAEWWNADHDRDYGFELTLSEPSALALCQKAADLFANHEECFFPQHPSLFKRVATYLVLGLLYPFMDFRAASVPGEARRRNAMPMTEHDKRTWRVRFMVDTFPALMARLKTELPTGYAKVSWCGFPSDHVRLEFFNWLKWLDSFEQYRGRFDTEEEWQGFVNRRLARMIMATSLIIEVCVYYGTKGQKGIVGEIGGCLAQITDSQREDLDYDRPPPSA